MINMNFFSLLSAAAVIPSADNSWVNEIPGAMKRRDPRLWHIAYVAAVRAVTQSSKKPASVAMATALGALDETKNFLDGIFADGFGSPRNFIASVHNSMAGKIALELKIPGPNLTFCDGCNSFASAVAACELLKAEDFPVLVIAADENIELLGRLIPYLSLSCRNAWRTPAQEGAIAFVVDQDPNAAGWKIRSTGPLFIGNENADTACREMTQTPVGAMPPSVILPSECRGSPIAAAALAHQLVTNNTAGSYAIGSFSPSSKSIALVTVCR